MKPKRKVRLVYHSASQAWSVEYCQREFRGRYWAACFDARDHTKQHVEAWVVEQPNLVLEGESACT